MPEKLICPRCGGKLDELIYETAHIDRCLDCGGAWLDSGEMEMVLEAYDEKFTPAQIAQTLSTAAAGVSEGERASVELCPICSARMNPLNFNYSSGIVIDVCPTGHGIWFDRKELDAIQVHHDEWREQVKTLADRFAPEVVQARATALATLQANTKQSAMGRPLVKMFFHVVEFVKSALPPSKF